MQNNLILPSTTDPNKRNLVVDQRSDADFFTSKSHEKISEAIVNLLQAMPNPNASSLNNQSEGIMIGLTGPYGSGKSTVIEILKKKLDAYNNAKLPNGSNEIDGYNKIDVFIFDAWSHQGNALRRSFLNQLSEALIDKDQRKEPKYREWKRYFDGTIDTAEFSEEHSELTSIGIIATFASVLIAFGYSLINKVEVSVADHFPILHQFGTWIGIPDKAILAYIGMSFIFIPLIFIALYFVLNTIKKRNSKIVTAQQITKVATHSTGDPTSIEFRDLFVKLLQCSASVKRLKGTGGKLLIVVDNLDRVIGSDVTHIWATLKTFFEKDSSSECNIGNVSLLVPYDLTAVRSNLTQIHLNDDLNHYAEALLDKAFQVQFDIPPLMYSEWRKFFESQLKIVDTTLEISGDNFSKDCADLANIYRVLRRQIDAPTPREIKLFINRLVANHLSRSKKTDTHIPSQKNEASISIKTLALWLMWKEHFTSDIEFNQALIKLMDTNKVTFSAVKESQLANIEISKNTSKGNLKKSNANSFFDRREHNLSRFKSEITIFSLIREAARIQGEFSKTGFNIAVRVSNLHYGTIDDAHSIQILMHDKVKKALSCSTNNNEEVKDILNKAITPLKADQDSVKEIIIIIIENIILADINICNGSAPELLIKYAKNLKVWDTENSFHNKAKSLWETIAELLNIVPPTQFDEKNCSIPDLRDLKTHFSNLGYLKGSYVNLENYLNRKI